MEEPILDREEFAKELSRAQAGELEGMASAANCYAHGFGVNKNLAKSAYWCFEALDNPEFQSEHQRALKLYRRCIFFTLAILFDGSGFPYKKNRKIACWSYNQAAICGCKTSRERINAIDWDAEGVVSPEIAKLLIKFRKKNAKELGI